MYIHASENMRGSVLRACVIVCTLTCLNGDVFECVHSAAG